VVTVNQPGAGGGIAARVASQSPNDGYTLYLPSTSTFLALPGGPGVAPNMPVELPRDFASIAFVLQQPIFIGASHKSGITSLLPLIEMAKQRPNEITYAATGRGRLTHLTMELFQARTGVKLQLVPYAGGPAQAMNDVMSGRVHLVLDAYAGLAAALKGDLIKGLADTALERLPGFEDLPTVAETIPGFFVGAWTVMLAPVGTAESIIRKVNADLRTALEDPDVKTKFAGNGAFVRHMTPEQVTEFVQSEQKTWRPILEQVNREATK
jgi:tripartite-type tricarboxylate transporter receptor subunit TctC